MHGYHLTTLYMHNVHVLPVTTSGFGSHTSTLGVIAHVLVFVTSGHNYTIKALLRGIVRNKREPTVVP